MPIIDAVRAKYQVRAWQVWKLYLNHIFKKFNNGPHERAGLRDHDDIAVDPVLFADKFCREE